MCDTLLFFLRFQSFLFSFHYLITMHLWMLFFMFIVFRLLVFLTLCICPSFTEFVKFPVMFCAPHPFMMWCTTLLLVLPIFSLFLAYSDCEHFCGSLLNYLPLPWPCCLVFRSGIYSHLFYFQYQSFLLVPFSCSFLMLSIPCVCSFLLQVTWLSLLLHGPIVFFYHLSHFKGWYFFIIFLSTLEFS